VLALSRCEGNAFPTCEPAEGFSSGRWQGHVDLSDLVALSIANVTKIEADRLRVGIYLQTGVEKTGV
jgi:hypothetical protein